MARTYQPTHLKNARRSLIVFLLRFHYRKKLVAQLKEYKWLETAGEVRCHWCNFPYRRAAVCPRCKTPLDVKKSLKAQQKEEMGYMERLMPKQALEVKRTRQYGYMHGTMDWAAANRQITKYLVSKGKLLKFNNSIKPPT